VIPIILATSVSVTAARLLSLSVFETLIEARGLPYLPDVQYEDTSVAEIMDKKPSYVTQFPTIAEVETLLLNQPAHHVEIAVVEEHKEHRLFLGQISRDLLRRTLESEIELATRLKRYKKENTEDDTQAEAATQDSSTTRHRAHKESSWRIPLQPREAISLVHTLPPSQVHMLFVTNQLQNAFVTTHGDLTGFVTREILKQTIASQKQLIP